MESRDRDSWLKLELYPAGFWIQFGKFYFGIRILRKGYPMFDLFSERHGSIHFWRMGRVKFSWHWNLGGK